MSNNTAVATTQTKKPGFSVMISTPGYQNMINRTLRDPQRAQRFIAAITSAVAINPALQECDPSTVLSGALLGESLNLSPSPQLGQYYLVPFDNKKKGIKDAQFLLGYKGLIQLALRSGQYKRLNVIAIKDGELIRWDPVTEEIDLNLITDDTIREATKTIGYLASFEYLNGFRKTIYWSKEKMVAHADRYSQAFSAKGTSLRNGQNKVSFEDYEAGNYPSRDAWLYSSYWYKDFDGMAFKTMLRQLISKWGIMSIDLQKAFESDSDIEGAMDTGNELRAQTAPAPTALPQSEPAPENAAPAEEETVSLDDF